VQIVFPVHSFLHLFLCYVLSFFFLHILSHTHTSFLTPPLSLYPRFILLSPSLTLSLSHSLTHFCLNVDGTEAKSRNCICFLNGRSSSSQYLKVFFSVMLWRSTLALFAENIFLWPLVRHFCCISAKEGGPSFLVRTFTPNLFSLNKDHLNRGRVSPLLLNVMNTQALTG
jgi:hypothetical protein